MSEDRRDHHQGPCGWADCQIDWLFQPMTPDLLARARFEATGNGRPFVETEILTWH